MLVNPDVDGCTKTLRVECTNAAQMSASSDEITVHLIRRRLILSADHSPHAPTIFVHESADPTLKPSNENFAEQCSIEITRRDHSIIACLRHTHIFLFFAHIPFVVNHTINATPPERLQHQSGQPMRTICEIASACSVWFLS